MFHPRTSRRFVLAAPMAGLALFAAGCGDGDSTAAGDSAAEAAGADGSELTSVTVEHAMGATEVECTPDQVVTLGQGADGFDLGPGRDAGRGGRAWADETAILLADDFYGEYWKNCESQD